MSIHKWLVGFALAVVMIAALMINAYLFSARSFQFNLAQVAPGSNGILVMDTLDSVRSQIDQYQSDTAGSRGDAIRYEGEVNTLTAQINELQTRINATMMQLAQEVATLEGVLSRNEGAQPAASLTAEELEVRAASLIETPGLPAAQSASASSIGQTTQQLRALQDDLQNKRNELSTAQYNYRRVGGIVADADNRIIALKQTVVTEYDDFDRVVAEADSLRRTSPAGIGAALVAAHPAFTSTLLVLVMGALGAILYLFPAYMTRANPVTFAEIIMRMLFGMVSALAFYIVANAAIAGIAFVPGQSEAANNAALLNPFTVGLVGIIAGIMADDIAKWIQRRGTEILGGNTGGAARASVASDPDAGIVNPHGGPPPV
ncbi:MAG: hypothetical protein GC206_03020 [Alphaproteobacteria bacterium]|nr:hypothetical protein [Alphaproteobacteria bacterium]